MKYLSRILCRRLLPITPSLNPACAAEQTIYHRRSSNLSRGRDVAAAFSFLDESDPVPRRLDRILTLFHTQYLSTCASGYPPSPFPPRQRMPFRFKIEPILPRFPSAIPFRVLYIAPDRNSPSI